MEKGTREWEENQEQVLEAKRKVFWTERWGHGYVDTWRERGQSCNYGLGEIGKKLAGFGDVEK